MAESSLEYLFTLCQELSFFKPAECQARGAQTIIVNLGGMSWSLGVPTRRGPGNRRCGGAGVGDVCEIGWEGGDVVGGYFSPWKTTRVGL